MPSPRPQELPTVAALSRLWGEVSSKPLWAPPNFKRYLRLRLGFRLKLLDPVRVRVLAPPGKINDCAACSDNCCVGPRSTVLLRLKDIATLIDLGRTDLMTQQKPQFSATDQDYRPALRRHLASDAWRVFPVLRQNNLRACAALTPEGSCSLFPHWPLSCARFPYAVHVDEAEAFFSPRCQSFWIRAAEEPKVKAMVRAAVNGYNERIKDAILLSYVPEQLEALGVSQYVSPLR